MDKFDEIVRACQASFGFEVPSVLLKKRTEKSEMKFHAIYVYNL